MEAFQGYDRLEKRMIAKAILNEIPLSGSLELLPLCNMNCEMCYVRLSSQELQAQGRLLTVEEWLQIAAQLKEAGTVFLLLTGGEPLLYPGFRELYLQLQEMGFILTINTNGTLIDEALADFLAEHRPRRVNVTVYGTTAETYEALCHYPAGFEAAVRGISLLSTRGIDVKINGSMVRANREECAHLHALSKELGAACHVDTYMYPAVRERSKPYNLQARLTPEQAAEEYLLQLKAENTQAEYRRYVFGALEKVRSTEPGRPEAECMQCQAGRSSFTVNWQGLLRPCVMMQEPGYPLLELGFSESWRRMRVWQSDVRLCPDCADCRLRGICHRCAASCLFESGSLQGKPEYLCRMQEALLMLLEAEAAAL